MHLDFQGEPGKWIKARREELGLSQKDLARLVHVSYSSISSIEQGRRKVACDVAKRLATTLQIPSVQQDNFVEFVTSALQQCAIMPSPADDQERQRRQDCPGEYAYQSSSAVAGKNFLDEHFLIAHRVILAGVALILFIVIGILILFTTQRSPHEKQVVAVQEMVIAAQGGFVPVELQFLKGDVIRFSQVEGTWTLDVDGKDWPYVDCHGYSFSSGAPQTYAWAKLRTYPVGILIGQWGDHEDRRFPIRCGTTIVADSDENLFLTINDSDEVGDNGGTMRLKISIER